MNPSNLHNFGSVDRLMLGMSNQPAQNRDEFISEELTNHLFRVQGGDFGLDLAAMNIQRGRDHGIPPYTYWRTRCSLRPVRSFADLLGTMTDDTVGRLRMVYRNVHDIDLFTAGLAEKPVISGIVGPTLACIIAQQFRALRRGDRFWYETGGFESSFSLAQLREIRKTTLARVICDNLDDIGTLQPLVMHQANPKTNPRVLCRGNKIPALNLNPWLEVPKQQPIQLHANLPLPTYNSNYLHTIPALDESLVTPYYGDDLPTHPILPTPTAAPQETGSFADETPDPFNWLETNSIETEGDEDQPMLIRDPQDVELEEDYLYTLYYGEARNKHNT